LLSPAAATPSPAAATATTIYSYLGRC
jgi:hypothetical protein